MRKRETRKTTVEAPELAPEEGWVPLELGEAIANANSFVSGPGNGRRLRVRYFHCDPAGTLAAKAWFGPDSQGPPGHAHGGSIAAVLDEVMGAAAWARGHQAVAASITVHFRKMLPLGTVCKVGAWVTAVEGRKVHTRGVLAMSNGQAVADAEGLFVVVEGDRFGDPGGLWRDTLALGTATDGKGG